MSHQKGFSSVVAIVVLLAVLVAGFVFIRKGCIFCQHFIPDKAYPQNQTVAQTDTSIIDWVSLIPNIRTVLKKAFPNEQIEMSYPISSNSLDVNIKGTINLVALGSGGATTDSIALIKIENGKPVVPMFKQKDGKISTLVFSAGAGGAGRYGSTAEIIENGNAVYSASYSKYGEVSDYCRLEAYRWNDKANMFEYNAELSNQFEPDYCSKAEAFANEVLK